MTVDWIHLAILVGALQGFLVAGALVAHRTNRTANRLLAALVVTFTISLLQEVYYSAGLVRVYPHFFGISYPLPWVFGPLAYLYAAPTGLIPCPTLSLVIGFALLGGGLGSRAWSISLAAVGLFYGLFGVMRLRVYWDIPLIFGAAALLAVAAASRRLPGQALAGERRLPSPDAT